MTGQPPRIVVADANVLFNLMHVARLGLCTQLPGLEIVVPDHVREEVLKPEQRALLNSAVTRGLLRIVQITEQEDVTLFADLQTRMGRGEAACLVIASRHGWVLASDEKGRFRREAASRIGAGRIIGTADFLIYAIRAGLLTIQEADADKTLLERRRFRMPFGSFREMV